MNDSTNNQLEERLSRALESAPTPLIPGDFALRVLQHLPTPSRYVTVKHSVATYVGRRVAVSTLVILTALMFWLAPTPSAWDTAPSRSLNSSSALSSSESSSGSAPYPTSSASTNRHFSFSRLFFQ